MRMRTFLEFARSHTTVTTHGEKTSRLKEQSRLSSQTWKGGQLGRKSSKYTPGATAALHFFLFDLKALRSQLRRLIV